MNGPSDEQPRDAKKVRLEGELTEDKKKEETTQKEEGKAAVAKIDTAVVASNWSPRRASRGGIKVHSLADGNFRGGDFVLDITDGNACTASFLLRKPTKYTVLQVVISRTWATRWRFLRKAQPTMRGII